MVRGNLFRLSGLDILLRGSGIAAAFIFLIFVVVIGSLHPDYSHLTQAVSVLGARDAPYKDFLNYGCLIPVGILTFIFSISMFLNIRGNKYLITSSILVMLVGIGRFFAGVFPCDPGCTAFSSVSAKLHTVAGLTALTAGAFAPLLMAAGLIHRQAGKYFYLSAGPGIVSLIIIIAGVSGLSEIYFGLVQRLLLLCTYAWIIIVAIGMENLGNKKAVTD